MLRILRWPKALGREARSHVIVVAPVPQAASPSLGLVQSLLTALFCQDCNLVQVAIECKTRFSPHLEFRLTDLRVTVSSFPGDRGRFTFSRVQVEEDRKRIHRTLSTSWLASIFTCLTARTNTFLLCRRPQLYVT